VAVQETEGRVSDSESDRNCPFGFIASLAALGGRYLFDPGLDLALGKEHGVQT